MSMKTAGYKLWEHLTRASSRPQKDPARPAGTLAQDLPPPEQWGMMAFHCLSLFPGWGALLQPHTNPYVGPGCLGADMFPASHISFLLPVSTSLSEIGTRRASQALVLATKSELHVRPLRSPGDAVTTSALIRTSGWAWMMWGHPPRVT